MPDPTPNPDSVDASSLNYPASPDGATQSAVQQPQPDVPVPDPMAALGGAPSSSPLDRLAQSKLPTPTQAPPQHNTLNLVLKGVAYALAGSAAGMGAKTPGAGAAAGAERGIELTQQAKQNARADQAQANQNAETQANVRFKNVQAAESVAHAAMYDKQLHNMDQQFQDEHNARAADFMKDMRDLGIMPTIVADNHGQGANTALQQLTSDHGGVPNMHILNLGDKLVGYDLGQLTNNNAIRDRVNKISEIQGLGSNAYTPARWGMIGNEGREAVTAKALSFFMPMPTKDNVDSVLQQYKNYQQTYAQNPNADPELKQKLDDTVNMLEKSRTNFVAQKADEAAQVAQAEQPIKAETAGKEEEARIKAQLSNEDLQSTAQDLVEHNIGPDQLSKRATTYNAQLAAAKRYSLDKYGKPFDLAKSQADYSFAKDKTTQNRLKYLNSLTGNPQTQEPGILDKLIEQSKKVPKTDFPALNDATNWARLKTGNPEIVKLHDLVLDASEQFGFIMNGGGSGAATSDSKIRLAQELFKAGFNQKQLEGSAETVRDMLGTRKREIISGNPYLEKWYSPGGKMPEQAEQSNSGMPQAEFPVRTGQAATLPPGSSAVSDNGQPAQPVVTGTDAQGRPRLGLKPSPSSNAPPPQAGFTRIKASDGVSHDVPTANLDKARKIDPGLQVIESK